MLGGVHLFFCFSPSVGMQISTFLTPPERECHKIKFSDNFQMILLLLYFSLGVGSVVFWTCFGSALPTNHGDHIFCFFFGEVNCCNAKMSKYLRKTKQNVICATAIHAQTSTLLLALQMFRNLCWVLHVCVIPIAGWTEKFDCYNKNSFSDQASTRPTSTSQPPNGPTRNRVIVFRSLSCVR